MTTISIQFVTLIILALQSRNELLNFLDEVLQYIVFEHIPLKYIFLRFFSTFVTEWYYTLPNLLAYGNRFFEHLSTTNRKSSFHSDITRSWVLFSSFGCYSFDWYQSLWTGTVTNLLDLCQSDTAETFKTAV